MEGVRRRVLTAMLREAASHQDKPAQGTSMTSSSHSGHGSTSSSVAVSNNSLIDSYTMQDADGSKSSSSATDPVLLLPLPCMQILCCRTHTHTCASALLFPCSSVAPLACAPFNLQAILQSIFSD